MSDANGQSLGLKNPFDSWKSIVISLYMTLIGYGVLVGIPVISTAWVTLLGFTEVEVGRVAGADLGGLSIGAVVTAMLIGKVNRRLLVLIGLSLAVVANGLCISVVDYDQVLWLRLLSGIGSGIYTAVAVSSLGASSKPARAYNAMLFAFAFSQALEMHFLPLLSMTGIYTTFIVCFLLTIPFISWIPAHAPTEVSEEVAADSLAAQSVPKFVPWLCLAAMVITYINIGAYWTYIELAAASDQADPEWVGQVLTWSSFCSLIGCLFATILSSRYGLLRPLLVTLVAMAVIVGMLANGITDKNILISVLSFNFLWIFIDVYQMSTIANVDKTGRFAALMPGAQGLGQIIGPNLAASILGLNLGYSGVFIMCSGAAIVAMLLYAFMYLSFRRTIPAFAYAT
ncbi:MAG: MFS transporter [Porticoccaceae bacterium]|jgi:predicted MFS family arabinose efflux permease|nr:MFS transporter [Porticoccaceae bacterium]